MQLKIEITMDNAAFEPENGTEAARILRMLADRIEGDNMGEGTISLPRDANGNRVGSAEVTE